MPWPDVTEFTEYLQASGLYGISPTAAQLLLDLEGALAAGIEQWENMTRYWPFLSNGDINEGRFFDPDGSSIIDLNGGLLRFTSLSTDIAYDANVSGTISDYSSGQERVDIRDFALAPSDAPSRKRPYTYIKCGWWTRGAPASIKVVGEWGYCIDRDLPKTARRAVMALAAMEVQPQIQRLISQGGLKRLTRGDETKEWGIDDLRKAGLDWQSVADSAVKQYQRVIIR